MTTVSCELETLTNEEIQGQLASVLERCATPQEVLTEVERLLRIARANDPFSRLTDRLLGDHVRAQGNAERASRRWERWERDDAQRAKRRLVDRYAQEVTEVTEDSGPDSVS